ncbi:MAG: alpha/beta fold hydrolase, partial [Anaerolineales bacterium]
VLRRLVWNAPRQQKKMEARLGQLTTSTRAVWGERDLINSVESGRALVAVQSGATLTVVPGVGHNVQQEAPEELVRLVNSSQ